MSRQATLIVRRAGAPQASASAAALAYAVDSTARARTICGVSKRHSGNEERRALRRVCVYCGSARGDDPRFASAAEALGRALAERSIELVYGGGRVGLMGVVADATLAAGGRAHGVIPQRLHDLEVAHTGLSELYVVESMHARKVVMAQLSDAFIALPGGWGTLEELFEVTTWNQLGIHDKPVGVLNVAGYYDALLEFLAHAKARGFIRPRFAGLLRFASSIETLLATLERAPPADPR
ncbi:MAG: TIGR00730 family Rossman fold protein [Myxococcales bacterium]|nr:TIGR00730 family Rossman fold protein [Myxococcales bacterium]